MHMHGSETQTHHSSLTVKPAREYVMGNFQQSWNSMLESSLRFAFQYLIWNYRYAIFNKLHALPKLSSAILHWHV